jgi:hypothetical protein
MEDGPSKKSQIASERDDEARGLWRWLASRFDARRLVFVDESGFNTSMTRLYARAPKGKRAYGKVPRNRGKNTTLIAAITLDRPRWLLATGSTLMSTAIAVVC